MDSFFPFHFTEDKSNEEQIMRLGLRISQNPEDIFLHRQFVEALTKYPNTKRAQRSIESLKTILTIEPEDIDSLILLVRCYRLIQDFDAARNLAERCITKYPDTAGFHEELGRTYIADNKFDQAKQILLPAFKKFSSDKRLARAVILYYEQINDLNTALEITNHELKLEPENLFLLQSKIIGLEKLKGVDYAIEFAEGVKEKFPKIFTQMAWSNVGPGISGGLSFRLAILYYQKAINILNKVEHLDFEIKDEKLEIKNGLTSETKTLLEKANDLCIEILSNSMYSETQDNIKLINAGILCHLTRFDESLLLLNEISEESIFILDVKRNYVFNLFLQERFQDAIRVCKEVLIDYPNHRFFNKYLLLSYKLTGRTDEYDQLKKKLEKKNLEKKDGTKNEDSFKKNSFSIDNDNRYSSFIEYQELWKSFKGELRLFHPHVKVNFIQFLHDYIGDSEQIRKIEIIGGDFGPYDGGVQFFRNYRKLKKEIEMFNETHTNCQIIVKIFLGESQTHARYIINDKVVWNSDAGYDQVEYGQNSEFTKLPDDTAILRKKQIDKLWNLAITLNENNFKKICKNYVEKLPKGTEPAKDIMNYLDKNKILD